MKTKVLIYGASGYTAKLFAKSAIANQVDFILAGRSAFITDATYSQFSLENPGEIDRHLNDVKLLINLAGPFSKTNTRLIEACLRTQTHYIDIAGEYPDAEAAYRYNEQAAQAGVMLMPGAGFGVVPTDIAAKLAAEQLPDATYLTIAYMTKGGASRGTLYTILKDIARSGIKIVNGQQEAATPAHAVVDFTFKNTSCHAVYNPWRADLFTAALSTGIKNIETYSGFPGFIVKMMQGKLMWLRNFLVKRIVKWLPEGPNEKQLNSGSTLVMARVSNEKGESRDVFIEGPEAYLFYSGNSLSYYKTDHVKQV